MLHTEIPLAYAHSSGARPDRGLPCGPRSHSSTPRPHWSLPLPAWSSPVGDCCRGGAGIARPSWVRTMRRFWRTEPEHPVERAVVEKWRTAGSTTPTLLRVRAVRAGAVREIGDRLVSYGLLVAPPRARARLFAARVLVVVVCGTAVLAAFAVPHGLRQTAPYLVVGFSCLAVRVLCSARGPLTPMGRRRLTTLRASEPWAATALGAVVFDGRGGLPGERRRSQRWNRGGGRLPSVGRMLIKYGKALDSDSADENTDNYVSESGHGSHGYGGSHDSYGSHGSSYDGGGHHHSCGSSCGGGNY
ncbi:TIGR04222 domain-containing membrane protein [Streptomyces yanii]|uniref:TIGR04222 domain-containing membrane protein n=1 Tax=Streptomyces yanii TaxID=78510 RepID=UPI0031E7B52E